MAAGYKPTTALLTANDSALIQHANAFISAIVMHMCTRWASAAIKLGPIRQQPCCSFIDQQLLHMRQCAFCTLHSIACLPVGASDKQIIGIEAACQWGPYSKENVHGQRWHMHWAI